MGFYLNDDLKIHLNLSETAWLCLENDMAHFNWKEHKTNYSGIINRIFLSFYETADASISLRMRDFRLHQEHLLGTAGLSDQSKETVLNILCTDKLKQYTSQPHLRESYRKIRVNQAVAEILEDSSDDAHYNGSVGKYLQAILEEYAILPYHLRERLYFREFCNQIQDAITLQRILRIKTETDTFLLKAYTLVSANNLFNYIIGFGKKESDESTTNSDAWKLVSMRLSRVGKIKTLRSMKFHFDKKEQKLLHQSLTQRDIAYMIGEPTTVTVQLTDNGNSTFQKKLHLRPRLIRRSGNIYEFSCTLMQAENYFFSFGKEALILSPAKLNEQFRVQYEQAASLYADQIQHSSNVNRLS